MAIIPPEIQQGVPIVSLDTGASSSYFTLWLAQVLGAIVAQTNANTINIAALQAAQAQIIAVQAQLVALQQAQNPASGKFGAASSIVSDTGVTWVNGPTVNLTGVTAGNLTYPGSGPNQVDSTEVNPTSGALGDFVGAWRIQEIIGFVETTVVTGTYAASRIRDDGALPFASVVYNTTNTTASVARATTGTMSYRLDMQAHDFGLGRDFEVNGVQLALYVNRA